MGKNKLRQPQLSSGKLITSAPTAQLHSPVNYPVFSFKYLHPNYNVEQCEGDDKQALIQRMAMIGRINWNELQLAPRHGIGCEKISKDSIRPGIPAGVPEHIDFFLAFRYNGKKAIIGWRDTFVFHLLYVDRNFSVYAH
ncbi:MAG: hypothetical protein MUC87_04590 [Bacteroidia bacterium]|jgi:hypothetical protein|nr:hypothetical protein [Bacteroidia bacterium]